MLRPVLCLPLLVALLGVPACSGGSTEVRFPAIRQATPMPRQSADDVGVAPFVGESVVPNRMAALEIPENPFLGGAGGDSRIHNDHYNSAAYNRAGPTGPNLDVITHEMGAISGVCATMAMLGNGYVVGTCFVADDVSGIRIWLRVFDNLNLDIVAERDLGFRPFIANAGGGAYFTLDTDENIIVGPAINRLEQYHLEVADGALQIVQDFAREIPGLAPAIDVDDPMLQDSLVDYEGRVWFMVNDGRIGYYERDSDRLEMIDLGRELTNSMVVDADGVFVATSESSVHLVANPDDGSVQVEWEIPYDFGSETATLQSGTGTTPTLFGVRDDLYGIADSADDQISVLVLNRADGSTLCSVPVFTPGDSETENTLIGYDDDFVIVNNAGFEGAFGPARTMSRGIERYRVLRDSEGNVTGCENVWRNTTSFGNSAQLTTEDGIIWGWGADPDYDDEDLFYVTATRWEDGEEVFRTYAGDSKAFDPITGQVHVHPDGTLYIGCFRGVVSLRDAMP